MTKLLLSNANKDAHEKKFDNLGKKRKDYYSKQVLQFATTTVGDDATPLISYCAEMITPHYSEEGQLQDNIHPVLLIYDRKTKRD